MTRPPLTDLERARGADEDTPVLTLACPRCGNDLMLPVIGGVLPVLECSGVWRGECDAPVEPLPAAWEMASAGAAPLPGFGSLSGEGDRD